MLIQLLAARSVIDLLLHAPVCSHPRSFSGTFVCKVARVLLLIEAITEIFHTEKHIAHC